MKRCPTVNIISHINRVTLLRTRLVLTTELDDHLRVYLIISAGILKRKPFGDNWYRQFYKLNAPNQGAKVMKLNERKSKQWLQLWKSPTGLHPVLIHRVIANAWLLIILCQTSRLLWQVVQCSCSFLKPPIWQVDIRWSQWHMACVTAKLWLPFQLQCTFILPLLFSLSGKGRRLSWPEWLVTYQLADHGKSSI